MKRGAKRVAGAVALMVLTGGVVQSWKNFRALKEAREKLAQEESAEAELRCQVAATEAMLAKSSARANELAADLRKIDEDQRKAAGAGKATGGGAKPRSLNVAHVIRHEPEAQMWFLEKQRGEMSVFYGPLFRQLGWGREKREAFIANVLARNEKWMDLDNLAHDDGDPEAIAKLRREASEAYDAAQRALLGAEGARRWEQYERTAGIRNMVSTLAGVAAVENVPITAAQADEAVRAIAEASEGYRKGGLALMESVDWTEAEAGLRKVFSPKQLEIMLTRDPGPTSGGLAQNFLYAEIARANLRERKDEGGTGASAAKR